MKKTSEFAMEKKVDYFGLYQKSESRQKTKISFNKSGETQKPRVRKQARKTVQTPAMKARQRELSVSKVIINHLLTNKKSNTETQEESFLKRRRAELVHAKELIQMEVETPSFRT